MNVDDQELDSFSHGPHCDGDSSCPSRDDDCRHVSHGMSTISVVLSVTMFVPMFNSYIGLIVMMMFPIVTTVAVMTAGIVMMRHVGEKSRAVCGKSRGYLIRRGLSA